MVFSDIDCLDENCSELTLNIQKFKGGMARLSQFTCIARSPNVRLCVGTSHTAFVQRNILSRKEFLSLEIALCYIWKRV